MKHSDYKKGTSPTTGVAKPVYTTVSVTAYCPSRCPCRPAERVSRWKLMYWR